MNAKTQNVAIVNADDGAARMRQDRRVAAPLFFLVLAVYIVTYVGAFTSNDERALFSGTDSLVKRGEFTVNQIYWDYTNVGMETSEGNMVPNYEPAQMILAAPFYVWGRGLDAAVQGTMFFSAVAMAGAAALVYLCLIELRYRRRTALLAASVFAFATLAWPYSRTFFREPLTVLAYLGAVYALLRYRYDATRRMIWPAIAGGMLGLALITKQISIALIPTLLLLAVAAEWRRPGTWKNRVSAAVAAIVPLLACLLVNYWYTQTTLAGVELFARDIVDYTTNPQLSQSVPWRMMRGFVGLSVSPYKGLFWYAPVLLLGLIGAFPFTRRFPWEGLAFLGLIGAHFLGYSRYNYWSGGVAWGSRYMLPVIPFLVMLAAPVWAWLVGGREHEAQEEARRTPSAKSAKLLNTVARIAAWGLILLSVGIQVLGISVDVRAWEVNWLLEQAAIYGGIGQAIDALYLSPAHSPVLGHLRLLLAGTEPLDFAWVQLRQMGASAFVPAGLLLSLLLVGLACVAFVVIWRQPRRVWPVAAGMALATLAICTSLVLIYRSGDARYDPYGVDRMLQPMTQTLAGVPCDWQECQNALLVPDPVLTDTFLNSLAAPLVWYGVEPSPVDTSLMEGLLERYPRLWLARDRNAATDDQEGRRELERYLADHAYKVEEQSYDNWARLLQFSAAGQAVEVGAPGQALGDMTLERTHLGLERRVPPGLQPEESLSDGRVQAQTGDTLQVGLNWRAGEKPQANYTVFIQLLDDSSQVRVQRDRWPGDGLYPTASLTAGQVITDNLALPLDVPPGQYRLIAGMYRNDVEGLPRLTGPGGDYVLLGEIDVTSPGL